MKLLSASRLAASVLLVAARLGILPASGASPDAPASQGIPTGTNRHVLDLPTALRLAGARNLEVQMARDQLDLARARHESEQFQFVPNLLLGAGYRRHDNLIQDVAGHVVTVHKDAYSVGPTLSAQLELGEAAYRSLVAHRLADAAGFALESRRQQSALEAARGYFDLARAEGATGVAEDAVRIAEDFAAQMSQAVVAGIAFKGDALRAGVQADRNRLLLRQAREQAAVASARLVQSLHLDAQLQLAATTTDLVPLTLTATNVLLESLLTEAASSRPELREVHAQVEAARSDRDRTKYAPLVPSLGAQVFVGGFGGGLDGGPSRFGDSEDYQVTLGWRLGPGGLFDRGRRRAGDARLHETQLGEMQLKDIIGREVVEAHARVRSLADQIEMTRRALDNAGEALRLSSERKDFAVAGVLERIQAEQDLTRARLDYLTAVAEFDKAQFALRRAIGAGSPGTDR